jgi:hypothetical protein
MGRSTFEGPILSGDNRFSPFRNVGYTELVQDTTLILTNSTNGTAGYAGGSGQFVNGNTVPNVNATVYTPSSSVYPPAAATITADAGTAGAGTLYRGATFWLPYGSTITDIIIDTNVVITATGGTLGTVTAKIGNAFDATTYGSVTSVNASAARNTVTRTGAQLLAGYSTTGDITNPPAGGQGTSQYASLVSQVVVTFTIPYTGGTGTTLPVITAGTLTAAIRYTQLDANIGNSTTYPYGNFD